MKKVKITTFLSILCAVLLFSISTQAQTQTLKNLVQYFGASPMGESEGNPYIIKNANDLEFLAVTCWVNSASTSGKFFQLQNDIDLSSSAFSTNFLPIGGLFWKTESASDGGGTNEDGYAFKGIFDGNNKTISKIRITVPDDATLKKITISGGATSGDYDYTYYLGNDKPSSSGGTLSKQETMKCLALFGGISGAQINNLGISDMIISGEATMYSKNRAGMVAEIIQKSSISNCSVVNLNINGGTTTDYYAHETVDGAFLSYAKNHASTITNCYAKDITVSGGKSGCFAANVGNSIITNCYVSGSSTITNTNATNSSCFVASSTGTFTNCYTTATIGTPTSGTTNTNNFCNNGTKTNCYYLIADAGTETTNTTVSAKKSTTMQSNTFANTTMNSGTLPTGVTATAYKQSYTFGDNNGYPIFNDATQTTVGSSFVIKSGEERIIQSDYSTNQTTYGTIPSTITIKDGGSLINNGDASLLTDKKINVERKLKAGAWNLVGSVLTSNTMVALNNNAGVTEPTYKHDMAAVDYSYTSNDWNSTTYLTTSSDFTSGKSYFVYPLNRYTTDGINYTNLTSTDNGYNEDIILTQTKASGVSPNTSSVVFGSEAGNITLDNQGTTTTEKQGYWFALSNPYIGKIDIASFISHNSGINTVISGKTVYTYDVTSGWSGQTTGSIYPGQGFMVAKSAKGVLSATIAQSYNSKSSNNTIKPLEEMMTFTSNANGTEKKAYVNINAQAENTFDDNDAFVLFSNNNDNFVEPYFVVDNRNIYKNEFKTMPYTTPINFHASKVSNTSLTVSNIPNNVSVSIVDLSNGQETALDNGSTFNFVANQGENEGRFVVKFGKKSVSIEDNAQENNISLSMYPNPATSQTTLVLSGVNGNAQVLINDVQGRVVNTYNVAKGQTTLKINTNSLASGVYYVRVISNNTSKTEKLIVR